MRITKRRVGAHSAGAQMFASYDSRERAFRAAADRVSFDTFERAIAHTDGRGRTPLWDA